MKRTFAVLGMVLLAALLIMPGTATSEMYIEGYMGGVGASNSSQSYSDSGNGAYGDFTTPPAGVNVGYASTWNSGGSIPGRFDNPFFTGGMKLGIWFDRTGVTGGYNWPDWAKYFGFYLDLSYHNLNLRQQTVSGNFDMTTLRVYTNNIGNRTIDEFVEGGSANAGSFYSHGRMFTLGFMFGARYGFLPDSEVPMGRLQPYVAVGPALFISSQSPSTSSGNFFPPGAYATIQDDIPLGPIAGTYTGGPHRVSIMTQTKSSVDIGLAVDAGFRYYMLKNVSLDVFFKYRWVKPSYNFAVRTQVTDPFTAAYTYTSSSTNQMDLDLSMFSGNVGVAYHF
jgi:hypothetical protein